MTEVTTDSADVTIKLRPVTTDTAREGVHSNQDADELRGAMVDEVIVREWLGLDLNLPTPSYLTTRPGPRAIRARNLADRFEASFHSPHIDRILDALEASSQPFVKLGDSDVSEIRPITRFRKRQYVRKGGIPLLGSKQIFQYDPIDVKKLALGAHSKDLAEIGLTEGMILVACSGTTGKVQLIPKYMEGWATNQHATRVIARVTAALRFFLPG